MGWNSTIAVMNDALNDIRNDPDFGKNLAEAVSHLQIIKGPIDIRAGNHVNAAHAVESHHADMTSVVTVGGNLGIRQLLHGDWNHHLPGGELEICRQWAKKLGYELRAVNAKPWCEA